jgi:hypothetical protein
MRKLAPNAVKRMRIGDSSWIPGTSEKAHSVSYPRRGLRETFPEEPTHRFLVYDNDAIFSAAVTKAIENFQISPKRTAFRSPRQNGTAKRLVGSVRRELLDHVVVLNEEHLRRLLREYVDSYNAERVHTSLQDAPVSRPVEGRPSPCANVVGFPRVDGLRHRYAWRVAS